MKTTILPKAIYRVNVISIKLLMAFFTELEQKFYSLYGNTKKPRIAKGILKKRMELEESTCVTSDYTTKLQSSRQYGIGTKTGIQTNGTRQKAQRQIHTAMGTFSSSHVWT